MENLKKELYRHEVLMINLFVTEAARRYETNGESYLLLRLVDMWAEVEVRYRDVVGRKILWLVLGGKVRDPEFVRNVLRHIGTVICTWPKLESWRVVARFIQESELLSVNILALEAGIRLFEINPERSVPINLAKCVSQAKRLHLSRSPEAQIGAEKFLKYFSQELGMVTLTTR